MGLVGLGRAVYGGKPHDVPKALQSVNMKNTSERRKEGAAGGRPVGGGDGGTGGLGVHTDMWLITPTLQLACPM